MSVDAEGAAPSVGLSSRRRVVIARIVQSFTTEHDGQIECSRTIPLWSAIDDILGPHRASTAVAVKQADAFDAQCSVDLARVWQCDVAFDHFETLVQWCCPQQRVKEQERTSWSTAGSTRRKYPLV